MSLYLISLLELNLKLKNIPVTSKFVGRWWWWWIVFVVWLIDERIALFSVGTIVKDLSTPQAGYEHVHNLSSCFVEWSCTVVKQLHYGTINLNFAKVSRPDYIPVMVWKNCNPKLSSIPAYLLNMSEGILFSRSLEGLICSPCIWENWRV